MAMAMHSVNSYPSAPTKDGILPSLLSFKYSVLRGPLETSVSTISRSSLFALATARMAVERAFPCRSYVQEVMLQREYYSIRRLTSRVYNFPKDMSAVVSCRRGM